MKMRVENQITTWKIVKITHIKRGVCIAEIENEDQDTVYIPCAGTSEFSPSDSPEDYRIVTVPTGNGNNNFWVAIPVNG